MSLVKIKPLHVAESIEELKKLSELGAGIKKKSAHQLAKSMGKVLERAEEQRLLGDEENAYIFYMKYFNLMTTIRKLKDFDKIRKDQRLLFGTNQDIHKRLDVLEKINVSLKTRYGEKEKLLHAQKALEEESIKSKNAYATAATARTNNFILVTQLYKQINDAKDAILLLDCRCSDDFEASKISFGNLINIREDIIREGISASKLGSKIPSNSQYMWEKRDAMDLIVLIDEDTSESQPGNTSKPIWILRKILLNWDPEKNYKSIRILEGGFQNFVLTYPMKTTNPKYDKKKDTSGMYPSLEGIEYPSFENIIMKTTDPEKQPLIPRIDRSSKPMLGQKTNDIQQPLNPVALAYEKEKMYDQILAKDKEVLNIGNELTQVVSSTRIPSDADPTELYTKHNELEYKFIQKENELNDTITELQSDFETLQIDVKNPEVAAINARIDQKAKEHSQYEKKRTETKQQIEERMNAMREQQKRHLQLKDEEEDLIRPKVPAFDRSSKPTTDRFESLPQIQRDFSPVHRSYGDNAKMPTGLKNLGNTCYMNSVIQCLLNLEELCEYFNTNLYTRHINRKSKTRGRVTDELAHLCKELCSGKYKSIAPRDFRNVVGQEHKIFAGYDQQDSHELLVILLDMLHLELQYPMDDVIVSGKLNKSEEAWRDFLKNKESRIQSMFFGQIRSLVKCKACGFESPTYEGFSHLSLELPSDSRQCELYDCLDSYFGGETIDGWTCPNCKQNREAVKKLDISKLPPVLVIHLKRFYASMDSANTYCKKQSYVRFPTNDLDINDYIAPALRHRKSQESYDLYAISNHYGTLNRGHYTAFCKNTKSKQWYKYDDNYVTTISSNDVNSSAGYILFYISQ